MKCPIPFCGAELDLVAEPPTEGIRRDGVLEDGKPTKRWWCPKCRSYYNEREGNALTYLAADKKDEATEELVSEIRAKFRIYTTRDDQKPEMWIYYDGIYIPHGETFIREFCRQRLDLAFKNTLASQVVDKIQADTYVDSKTFFNQPFGDEIPVHNGLLNLVTRELSPFTPDKIFFAKLPVSYDKAAACPAVDRHFTMVLKYAEDVPALYEMFGYCLNKNPFLEKAFMMSGSGRNGKGKTLSLVKSFLGTESCSTVSLQEIEEDGFALGSMFNKLANIGGDLPKRALKNASKFKTSTGRDGVSINRKFLPRLEDVLIYAKQIYAANELPIVEDTLAFWARWMYFEFPYTFVTQADYDAAEDKTMLRIMDEDIITKLTTPGELSGLLNAALDGLDRLKKNRAFSHCRSWTEVSDIWIRKANSFAAFWKDCLTEQWDGKIEKAELRRFYTVYCRINKVKPLNDKAILYFMSEKGVSDDRDRSEGRQITFWSGCVFKDSPIFGKGGMDGMLFSTYINFDKNYIGVNKLTTLTTLTTFTEENDTIITN